MDSLVTQPASSIESRLVKSLHPIGEIAARISGVNGGSVRLEREAADENGPTAVACSEDVAAPLDAMEATTAALAEPIDFPPLAAGIVPGDRAAIAVDGAIPCVAEIVRGAIKSLERAGVERDSISVVASDAATKQICRDAWSAQESNGVKFVVHDPDDEADLCLVGVTKRGEPLRVNRSVFDADVVLPIGCARPNGCGTYESLFPRFSDAASIQRYRTPTNIESASEQENRLRETYEAGWLIGVPMVVEVVPGSGGRVASVLAGEPNAVTRHSQELLRQRWSFESPRQVNLMIATVTGGAESQNWTSIGRALATAERVVAEGGAVAICSNLSDRPGHSLGRLTGNPDLAAVERKIVHDHDEDSWPAWQLARALQRGPVYFLSQLDADTVEDLGLAPVENIEELVRLATRHGSFLVVEDSQNAVVKLADRADGD